MRAAGQAAGALCAAWLTAACTVLGVQAPAVDDLRIESVQVAPDTASAFGRPRMDSMSRLPESPQPLMRVVVSTQADLSDHRRRSESTIHVRDSPCHPGDTRGASRNTILDRQGGDMSGLTGGPRPMQSADADGRRRYLLTFNSAAPDRFLGPFNGQFDAIQGHDIRTQPLDLCFRVEGGNMMFAHRSRPYRIPYAMIAQALAQAGMPHAPVP